MKIIYVPCANDKEAEKIAKILLDKKLIVCANMFKSKSMYYWKGKQCKERETLLLMKTTNTNVGKAKKEIEKSHSYDIPAIVSFDCKTNKSFEVWANKQGR